MRSSPITRLVTAHHLRAVAVAPTRTLELEVLDELKKLKEL